MKEAIFQIQSQGERYNPVSITKQFVWVALTSNVYTAIFLGSSISPYYIIYVIQLCLKIIGNANQSSQVFSFYNYSIWGNNLYRDSLNLQERNPESSSGWKTRDLRRNIKQFQRCLKTSLLKAYPCEYTSLCSGNYLKIIKGRLLVSSSVKICKVRQIWNKYDARG